jgi:urease accessory protein
MKRLAFLPALLLSTPALAHPGHGAEGFAAGLAHPLMGLDHVLAMVAVGLWAAMRGGKAMWAWPLAFVGGMVTGFLLTQSGIALPALETMIAGTLIGLGGALALGLAAPVALGAGLIGLFGALHGFAHGLEIHGAMLPFAAGFTLATAALHGLGLALGLAAARLASLPLLRIAGGGVAVAGIALIALA